LGLDDQLGTAELTGGGFGLSRCTGNRTARAWDLKAIEKLFGLVFVNVHGGV
jgi:hypothetical protein